MTARAGRRRLTGLAALAVLVLLGGGMVLWGLANGEVDGRASRLPGAPVNREAVAAAKPYRQLPCGPGDGKPAVVTVATRPGIRTVNIGFEDLVSTQPGHLAALARRLDEVDANAIQIAVGRLDWAAFPWKGHGDRVLDQVSLEGRDLVQEALDALSCDAHGQRRHVTLGVDALLDRRFKQDPSLAGVTEQGKASNLLASVSAWKTGPLGGELADFCGALSERYKPDAVNVTELMFFDATFGADDKKDFLASSGLSDWPRTADGRIDNSSPAIQNWKSEAVAGVMQRVSAAVRPKGTALTMDVSSARNAKSLDRADVGQVYALVKDSVDKFNLWYYPGLVKVSYTYASEASPEEIGRLVSQLYPGRVVVSLGLWNERPEGISAEKFQEELVNLSRFGQDQVSVTPASLLTDAHWEVLRKAWVG